MAFATMPAILAFVRAGRLHALAVIDSRRSKLLPDVPTIAEAGLRDAEAGVWYGVLAPPGTPPAIVDALAHAIATVTSTPQFHERLSELGAEAREAGPGEFAALLRNETARWKDVIRAGGLKAQ